MFFSLEGALMTTVSSGGMAIAAGSPRPNLQARSAGISAKGPDDIDVAISTLYADNFGDTKLLETTRSYIDFPQKFVIDADFRRRR